MHINYLAFRRRTHISHKLPEDYLNRMQEFVYYIIKFKSKYDFELNEIANMDEAPLYLSMPPYTTVRRLDLRK